jgi:protein involved in polysaccharide export with SLBB domain
VAGKTFRQVKKDAETIVANNYPLSGVQLILTQPGVFRVFVVGEVKVAAEISTWAMERLSSLIRYTTPFASLRNVSIKSANGRTKNYDLFKAEREGDLSQNPYLRPDDIITFNRLDRQITINGAVERPGVYQLLSNENLNDLIRNYACGFTPLADKTQMELVRYVGSGSVSGDKMIFTEADIQRNYRLQNYDIITIPNITERRPVALLNRQERRITIAGAVRRPGTYDLAPGENFRELIEIYGDGFTPLADKTRMELIRYVGGGSVSGDKMIFTEADIQEISPLQNYDTITIPDITDRRPAAAVNRQERRITIAGAVRRPGTYQLDPDENLKELIEIYADGLTPLADKTYMELVRYEGELAYRTILTEEDIQKTHPLQNYDTITIPDITDRRPVAAVNRLERRITIRGAVRRPGTYRLDPGENLKELIEIYADGLTPLADKTRMELVRYEGVSGFGERIFLSESNMEENFALHNYDIITIPDASEWWPVTTLPSQKPPPPPPSFNRREVFAKNYGGYALYPGPRVVAGLHRSTGRREERKWRS